MRANELEHLVDTIRARVATRIFHGLDRVFVEPASKQDNIRDAFSAVTSHTSLMHTR